MCFKKKYLHYVSFLLYFSYYVVNYIAIAYKIVKKCNLLFLYQSVIQQMEKGCKKNPYLSYVKSIKRKDQVWINNNKCFIAFCL